jgi:hypothetical protein
MDALDSRNEDMAKETTVCQKATEAYPEMMEANPEDMKPVVKHEEILRKRPQWKLLEH